MTWTCATCTFSNAPTLDTCSMCGGDRPVTVRTVDAPPPPAAAAPKPAAQPVAANEYVCERCTLVQSKAVTRCGACDAPNPHARADARSWTCSQCTFVNDRPGTCSMCGVGSSGGGGGGGFGGAGLEEAYGRDSEDGAMGAMGGMGAMGAMGAMGGADGPLGAMRQGLLEMVIPSLQAQLQQANIPASEGKLDGGNVIGEVAYQVGEIKCARCVLNKDRVDLNLDPSGRFVLSATEIELELAEFKWAYNKLSKLKISSSGTAVCAVRGVSVNVSIKLGANMMPEVEEVKSVVRDLDVTIKNTKLKLVYSLLIAAFKTRIKEALQTALEKATVDAVNDNSKFLQ